MTSPDLPFDPTATDALRRIADALEALVPKTPPAPDFTAADAFVWQPESDRLQPVPRVSRVPLALLQGIDRVRDILTGNTERFARGLAANNVLLWGARGMGKSSLVKAAHAEINSKLGVEEGFSPMKLIEIQREDIDSLPRLMTLMRAAPFRFLVSATTSPSISTTRATSR